MGRQDVHLLKNNLAPHHQGFKTQPELSSLLQKKIVTLNVYVFLKVC